MSIFWKILFVLIPPTEIMNGWATLIVSLSFIGGITLIMREYGRLFSCICGINESVIAFTLMTFSFVWPDIYVTIRAAKKCTLIGDPALTYIPLVNSATILFGIGVPWLVGSLYKGMMEDEMFEFNGDDLAYTCIL
jgi:solute carrier family 8 (sodium/calcium exchanger)